MATLLLQLRIGLESGANDGRWRKAYEFDGQMP